MSTPISNLPVSTSTDSSDTAKKFFNSYYNESITIPSNSLDATVGFFRNRGFSESAAQSISSVLLSQSRVDKIDVFSLLDTLKSLNGVQLSRIVQEVLNYNRLRISTLGTRVDTPDVIEYEKRNIIP